MVGASVTVVGTSTADVFESATTVGTSDVADSSVPACAEASVGLIDGTLSAFCPEIAESAEALAVVTAGLSAVSFTARSDTISSMIGATTDGDVTLFENWFIWFAEFVPVAFRSSGPPGMSSMGIPESAAFSDGSDTTDAASISSGANDSGSTAGITGIVWVAVMSGFGVAFTVSDGVVSAGSVFSAGSTGPADSTVPKVSAVPEFSAGSVSGCSSSEDTISTVAGAFEDEIGTGPDTECESEITGMPDRTEDPGISAIIGTSAPTVPTVAPPVPAAPGPTPDRRSPGMSCDDGLSTVPSASPRVNFWSSVISLRSPFRGQHRSYYRNCLI
ncbi:hypothetical protein [Bifidobacterium vansinderenii]|uniref:hypothetical protein n=1 Tax=Bifidobacterium vansinderenii TaxID=1984871 RepID=UPI001177F83F|nr:hypothetical protein [Bifidobacterium vansinderenii]